MKKSKIIEDYITETFEGFEGLKRTTKKTTSILKRFSTPVIPLQELHIEHFSRWIDYLQMIWNMMVVTGHHVDSIAMNISFGWYEGIFKYFSYKKVKVVSSMGEQSCGKSFMLNHLIGTTFNGSAMFTPRTIFMLKLLEKSSQEDMFFNTFNTNKFTVNKDMSSIFQRFHDGAMLFDSDTKIFKALYHHKDVLKAEKENIVMEFQSKFLNWFLRIYKGGLDINPWPMFNDAGWFKTLSNVNKDLEKQKAKYENARSYLQNTKLIMAK
ncbi:13159_t:CDS:2 [Funneliformis caledonium]|uniref:13159_t:CDS:1 n=1 Tax=Funneliformis caledonium TaxID=1117310 RepID=A0A9N9AKQ1_9GLOM|nr:13159_t:CDS:2 [Funneliformis caledonium]